MRAQLASDLLDEGHGLDGTMSGFLRKVGVGEFIDLFVKIKEIEENITAKDLQLNELTVENQNLREVLYEKDNQRCSEIETLSSNFDAERTALQGKHLEIM